MVLAILAEPQRKTVDMHISNIFKEIPIVKTNVAFLVRAYGFQWFYHFEKQEQDFKSSVHVSSSQMPNVLFIETDFEDDPVDIHWENIKATHCTDGKSNLSFSTVAWFAFYRIAEKISFLLTISGLILICLLFWRFPKLAMGVITTCMLISAIGPEHILVPHDKLAQHLQNLYSKFPPVLKRFLEDREIVLGVWFEQEILYLHLRFKDGVQVLPIEQCPRGVHLCIYLKIDLVTLDVSHLHLDIVEFQRHRYIH